MKKVVMIVFAAAFIAMSAVPPAVAAADGGAKYGKPSGDGLESKFCSKGRAILKNREGLGLTETQVANIRSLMAETKKSLIKRDAEIKTLKVEINTLMWEAPFDTEQVNNLIAEKYKLTKEKTQFLVSAYNELYSGLEPEQVKKANAL